MKLKKICGVCIITLLAFSSCKQSYVDELTTQYATISVDGKGFIRQVIDNRTDVTVYYADKSVTRGRYMDTYV